MVLRAFMAETSSAGSAICPCTMLLLLVKCRQPSYWGTHNAPGIASHSWMSHQDHFLEVVKLKKMLGRCSSNGDGEVEMHIKMSQGMKL